MLLSRNKPHASPWKLFVPERVTMFTAPEDVSPLEGFSVDCSMLNS